MNPTITLMATLNSIRVTCLNLPLVPLRTRTASRLNPIPSSVPLPSRLMSTMSQTRTVLNHRRRRMCRLRRSNRHPIMTRLHRRMSINQRCRIIIRSMMSSPNWIKRNPNANNMNIRMSNNPTPFMFNFPSLFHLFCLIFIPSHCLVLNLVGHCGVLPCQHTTTEQ